MGKGFGLLCFVLDLNLTGVFSNIHDSYMKRQLIQKHILEAFCVRFKDHPYFLVKNGVACAVNALGMMEESCYRMMHYHCKQPLDCILNLVPLLES